MPQPNYVVKVGFGKEPSWGTAPANPTFNASVMAPVFDPRQDPIFDQGLRGVRSLTQAAYFGAGHEELDVPDQPFYADDSGNWLMAMMGTDTIAGTARTGTIGAVSAGATSATYTPGTGGASTTGDVFVIDAGLPTQEIVIPTSIAANVWTVPASGVNSFKFAHGAGASVRTLFTHTLTVLNTSAPPSYTGWKNDGLVATARQVLGIYWESVDLKLQNPGSFTVGAKGKGKLGAQVTAPTYPNYSTEAFLIPWEAQFTIAGGANARVTSYELALAAPVDQIFGMNGTQSPTAAVTDQLRITGKGTVVPDDYTEFNYYIQNTQPAVSVLIDNGATRLVLQMSKHAFLQPSTMDHKGNFTEFNFTFEAVSNATDAGASGNAAIKATLYNQKATAY